MVDAAEAVIEIGANRSNDRSVSMHVYKMLEWLKCTLVKVKVVSTAATTTNTKRPKKIL